MPDTRVTITNNIDGILNVFAVDNMHVIYNWCPNIIDDLRNPMKPNHIFNCMSCGDYHKCRDRSVAINNYKKRKSTYPFHVRYAKYIKERYSYTVLCCLLRLYSLCAL